MRLLVVAATAATPRALAPWIRDPECRALLLTTLPRVPDESWQHAPVHATNHAEYSVATRHFDLCRPLLEAGAANAGPTMQEVEVSCLGAADFALCIETRQLTPLWLDLTRELQRSALEGIDLLLPSHSWPGVEDLCRFFARTHRLSFRAFRVRSQPDGSVVLRRRSFRFDGAAWRQAAYSLREALRPRSAPSPPRPAAAEKGASDSLCVGMLVYQPKSWKDLLPIREALLAAGHRVVLVSPRRATDQPLQKLGLPFRRAHPRWPGLRFLRRLRGFLRRLSFPQEDEALAPLVAPRGPLRRRLLGLAASNSTLYAGLARALPGIFRDEAPDLVMSTDSGSLAGRMWIRYAQSLGIPAVFLQHGGFSRAPHNRHYFVGQTLLLWGESSRQRLRGVGLEAESDMRIVGSPRLEAKLHPDAAATVPENLPDGPFVLVTFGIPGGLMSKSAFTLAAEEVARAASALDDVTFVIRPHPGDATDTWDRCCEDRIRDNVEIRRSADTHQLMHHCSALITMASTTGAEAAVLNKPVVTVNLSGDRVDSDYVEAGAAHQVRRAGELAPILRTVLASTPDGLEEARRNFGQAFLSITEESASQRILAELERLGRER